MNRKKKRTPKKKAAIIFAIRPASRNILRSLWSCLSCPSNRARRRDLWDLDRQTFMAMQEEADNEKDANDNKGEADYGDGPTSLIVKYWTLL